MICRDIAVVTENNGVYVRTYPLNNGPKLALEMHHSLKSKDVTNGDFVAAETAYKFLKDRFVHLNIYKNYCRDLFPENSFLNS